jgi:transposase-like protein
MGKRQYRRYTDEEKAAAVEFSLSHTVAETAREYGCSTGSVSTWVRDAGVERNADRQAQTQAATEAVAELARQRRAELKAKLLEKALDLLGRMDEEHIDYRGQKAEPVTYPRAPAPACSNYAYATGLLLRELRLEGGEPTDRPTVTHDYSERSDEDLIREAEQIVRDAAARQHPD